MKHFVTLLLACFPLYLLAQTSFTPELLWKLNRVSAIDFSKDKNHILYSVATPDMEANKINRKYYMMPLAGGSAVEIKKPDSIQLNTKISPDGKYVLNNREVKVKKVSGEDFYPDLKKSTAQIYTTLMYRHWDEWEDGKFNHVFFAPVNDAANAVDIMAGEPYDSPTKPFGGNEDYIWSPDGKEIIYVAKKKYGTEYALSTNTDLYAYNIASKSTRNLTEENKGYDLNPAFSKDGVLAWLQMRRDGYEADKQDIITMKDGVKVNLTGFNNQIHVTSFKWAEDGKSIFFTAASNGTVQLFEVEYTGLTKKIPFIRQITKGDFDVSSITGDHGGKIYVTRTDMNHAAEIFSVEKKSGAMQQLSFSNRENYAGITPSTTERRIVKTKDGKDMLMWVVYPPNFDKSKKYPTLLYCQGGPQSALTQFYSFRWNFQLMAAQGYIVVAPNRRGMPGHGTEWNEEISHDWGGKVMDDYLVAIDEMSKESFVDNGRLACVGASFGGYSAFYLAGIHNNRFKSFIAHDGVFDFRSMYGTTEELFFINWEFGGPYWESENSVAQKSFSQSPSNFVQNWNTPILIIQGGKDYRVPIEQGLQAFQAVQLKGIKSKLLYLPDENHWVLKPQNGLVWQREFFGWLKETLQ